jgi:hypothetical protein
LLLFLGFLWDFPWISLGFSLIFLGRAFSRLRLALSHQAIVVRKGQTRAVHAGHLEMPALCPRFANVRSITQRSWTRDVASPGREILCKARQVRAEAPAGPRGFSPGVQAVTET